MRWCYSWEIYRRSKLCSSNAVNSWGQWSGSLLFFTFRLVEPTPELLKQNLCGCSCLVMCSVHDSTGDADVQGWEPPPWGKLLKPTIHSVTSEEFYGKGVSPHLIQLLCMFPPFCGKQCSGSKDLTSRRVERETWKVILLWILIKILSRMAAPEHKYLRLEIDTQ